MIKTILVPTGGNSTDFIVFETALAVAHPFRAHLEFFHVRVDPADALIYSPHAAFARGQALRDALDYQKKETLTRSQAGREHFEEFCRRHGVKITDTPDWSGGVSANWHEEPGHEKEPFITQARTHDLVVMARAARPNGLPPDLLPLLLFGSGRPLLIPATETSADPSKTIMICWKDAAEPTRAIAAAMPLLVNAERVIIANVEENGRLANTKAVAQYLQWHGIHAETQAVKASGHPIPALLTSAAKECAADLLVMGAYGKGPLKESIFGGCTQSVLDHADVPVFLFH